MKELILLRRNYLLEDLKEVQDETLSKYYAAKLLNKFGVLVDKPNLVTIKHVAMISDFYGETVPDSFYSNPQDTKYFSCGELLLEQIISYFSIAFIHGVNSEDKEDFRRIELFKKALPDYEEGDEVEFRHYELVDDDKAEALLEDLSEDLSSYTRKWNETEEEEFTWLYLNGYWKPSHIIRSKDNVIQMFYEYKRPDFAKFLDQKDVVKLSIEMVGETSRVEYDMDQRSLLSVALKNCREVPLTKKQAKYYNTICKKVGLKGLLGANNFNSPFRLAKQHLAVGDIIGAAKVFARNGSLLERNIIWLLSRANFKEAQEIVDMIKINNPIVSIQFLNSLLDTNNGPRIFKFYRNRRLKVHQETPQEAKFRKSILSPRIKSVLKETFSSKIDEYYRSLPSLGKVYIDPTFEKIGLPLNTSASGTGIDVPPVGTRIPITEEYIRAFCYWQGPHDVDSSVSLLRDNGEVEVFYWGNYNAKPYGNSILCSGDDRSAKGSEYTDLRLDELKNSGFTHLVYQLNGFGDPLNIGEIYCGYQNKKDLDTVAWKPNNIALKFRVKGETRNYLAFAIDLETRELIVINQLMESGHRVVSKNDLGPAEYLLDKEYLNQFNIARIARNRGEVVGSPCAANYIFSNDPNVLKGCEEIQEDQKIIRSSDVEKLVKLLT
jgi:hypothetical protein